MKKKLIVIISATAGILFLISALLITNYFRDAMDYKNALAVQRDVVQSDDDLSGVEKYTDGNSRTDISSIEDTEIKNTASASENPVQDLLKAQDGIGGADTASVLPKSKTAEKDTSSGNTFNLLFLGTDRTEERDEWLKIYRTDTIALMSVNLDTKAVKVLCIPRDTYVYIPCEGKKDKINHAYAYGGMGKKGTQCTIETVENFIKYAAVDYYFTIDMGPIPEIVDSLGGIELDVEIDMKTHGANLSKGLQLLDGNKAFQYIHWRYSAGGDIDRIKRQQKFAKAMYTKLKESDQLLNAIKLVLKYDKYISTNLSTKQLVAMAALASDIKPDSTSYYIIPGHGEYINDISYWVADEKKTESLLKEFFGKN